MHVAPKLTAAPTDLCDRETRTRPTHFVVCFSTPLLHAFAPSNNSFQSDCILTLALYYTTGTHDWRHALPPSTALIAVVAAPRPGLPPHPRPSSDARLFHALAMNGADIKKAAINKAKQVAASASNGNAQKKRRAKQELQPIITTEQQASPGSNPMSS